MLRTQKSVFDSIGQINSAILGLLFVAAQVSLNDSFSSNPVRDLAFAAIALAVLCGVLAWGTWEISKYKNQFKNDIRTKRLTGIELLTNTTGLTLLGAGFFMVTYRQRFGIDGITPTYTLYPYLFEGFGSLIVGFLVFGLSIYLYQRFLPMQVMEERTYEVLP